jgi:hypothetical protein
VEGYQFAKFRRAPTKKSEGAGGYQFTKGSIHLILGRHRCVVVGLRIRRAAERQQLAKRQREISEKLRFVLGIPARKKSTQIMEETI